MGRFGFAGAATELRSRHLPMRRPQAGNGRFMARCAVQHFVKFLAGALLFVTPVAAEVSQDWMVCSGKLPAARPDQRVAACTAVIAAGGETPTNLAVAYCSRGVAHHARDQLDRAIADYNEAVRIAP